MKPVWNAILKNERRVLDRCVDSLMPHVGGAIVVDTGSADGTIERLRELFAVAGKPLEIHHVPFEDFSQARNAALKAARESVIGWEWLLLSDADMELKVHRPDWMNGADGEAYDIRQTAGSLGYWNRRLLHRRAAGQYIGPTHEYLDVTSAGALEDVEFIDHADGANRPEKLQRDIALLEAALRTETNPGLIERYTFYLAGSYFDLGEWHKAAEHYARRMVLGGFEEERWYARVRYALCLRNMGDRKGFLLEMQAAYSMRPSRAETLYELARFFRERGDNYTSLLFSEAGLRLPYPRSDLLFVDDWMHKSGLREEFAICAWYDPLRRGRGAGVCNRLALEGSGQAGSNLFWYLQPLVSHVPSFRPTQLRFDAPDGYVFTNPSVVNREGRAVVLLRAVNYRIQPDGSYGIHDLDGNVSPGNPIRTRNFLWDTAQGGDVVEAALPKGWPAKPAYELVRGFEDSRLFEWGDKLWTISTVRELNPDGWCEQVVAVLGPEGYDGWRQILPSPRRHEKNWAPFVVGDDLRFVYRPGTLVDADGNLGADRSCGFAVGHVSGGSQVVEADGAYLALVHEAGVIPGRPDRYYRHRFIRYAADGTVLGMSMPFFFFDRQIEFAAGLAYFPEHKQLMAGFGVMDREAWTATMQLDQVMGFIGSPR